MRCALVLTLALFASTGAADPHRADLVASSGLLAHEEVETGVEIGVAWDAPLSNGVRVDLVEVMARGVLMLDSVPVDPMTGIVTLTAPPVPGRFVLELVWRDPFDRHLVLSRRALRVATTPASP